MEPRLHRIIRKSDLPAFVGLHRTAIQELINAGEFPSSVPLNDSGRSVGWLEHELIAWQQERIAKRHIKPRPVTGKGNDEGTDDI